jgi:hypothetical protein
MAASASPVTINAGEIGKAFQVLLPTGGLFSAITSGGADTELYLFDAGWHPLAQSDDNPANPPNSLLFLQTSAAGPSPDVYHLIVTIFNAFPEDQAGNPLFDQGICGTSGVCGPATGQAGTPFAGNWSNLGGMDGHGVTATFDMSLTFNGSEVPTTPEALPTPEPASLFLFGTGAMGLAAKCRRRKGAA